MDVLQVIHEVKPIDPLADGDEPHLARDTSRGPGGCWFRPPKFLTGYNGCLPGGRGARARVGARDGNNVSSKTPQRPQVLDLVGALLAVWRTMCLGRAPTGARPVFRLGVALVHDLHLVCVFIDNPRALDGAGTRNAPIQRVLSA